MDEQSKKLFEKWAYENGYNVDKTETGSIISYQTNIASCVWQAATKQAALDASNKEIMDYGLTIQSGIDHDLDDEVSALIQDSYKGAEFVSFKGLQDKIESLQAELEKLDQHVADMIEASGQECCCGYDHPNDVCYGHYGNFKRLQAEIEHLKEELKNYDDAHM